MRNERLNVLALFLPKKKIPLETDIAGISIAKASHAAIEPVYVYIRKRGNSVHISVSIRTYLHVPDRAVRRLKAFSSLSLSLFLSSRLMSRKRVVVCHMQAARPILQ